MPDAIDKAMTLLTPAVDADPNIHTLMRGLEKVNGVYTGRESVVALVAKKRPEEELNELQLALPYSLDFGNDSVRIDVQEAAPFEIQTLDLANPDLMQYVHDAFGGSELQGCASPVVPGGSQIAPQGASWVGTLGVPWAWTDETGKVHIGFLTNRHVAGIDSQPGSNICQPSGLSKPIGSLVKSSPFHKTDFNLIDAALYDSEVNGSHYVARTVANIPTVPGWADLALGDTVAKSGRTTGTTYGTVVGLNARTTVGYGEHGNLRFKDQVLIEAPVGQFSAPGDSGSGIFRAIDSTRYQLGGLLFAGGGNRTIANPIRFVVEQFGGEPYLG